MEWERFAASIDHFLAGLKLRHCGAPCHSGLTWAQSYIKDA